MAQTPRRQNRAGAFRPGGPRRKRPQWQKRLTAALPGLLLVLVLICISGTLILYLADERDTDAGEGIFGSGLLDSPIAVLMERESGQVLASLNGTEKMYPASLTKMMTVLTALDEWDSPEDEKVVMDASYYQDLYDSDASRAGFDPGEEARIIDLMYGALLPSGAECCMQLALSAAGSEEEFVSRMNRKAAKLGMKNTHFANVTGLHSEEQYSTAMDLAKLLRAGLDNPVFYSIITTHHYSVPPTNLHPEGFTFWSTLFKATVDEYVNGGEIMGGKTGYTSQAGHCLASFATIDGKDYILVTGGICEQPRTESYHIDDAFRAYNQIKVS